MNRINRIISHKDYRKALQVLQEQEKTRRFCRHTFAHFLDVARIAELNNLENGCGILKERIYAAALLHDIGRSWYVMELFSEKTAFFHGNSNSSEETGHAASADFTEDLVFTKDGDCQGDTVFSEEYQMPENTWTVFGTENAVLLTHAQAGMLFARKILPDCGFSPEETEEICLAIGAHGRHGESDGKSELAKLLCEADRLSRNCFFCRVKEECSWTDERKNEGIRY